MRTHIYRPLIESCVVNRFSPTSRALSLNLYFMSQFSYSFTLRILESLPRVVNPGPNVSNSALVEPSLVTLPPLCLIIHYEKSLFNWLLERQEKERVGNCCKLNYVAITAHSPLHCIPSQ